MPPSTAQRNQVVPFAATPVLLRDISGHDPMNARLVDIILELSKKAPSNSRTNVGGWQSDTNFLENLPAELRQEFLDIVWGGIVDILTPMGAKLENYRPRITGWANILVAGGLNVPHIHPNGVWSAVYYLASGDPNSGGELHLMDPRPQAAMFATPLNPGTGELIYAPSNSSVIIFPSWLMHYVMPYTGKSPRINIAINCG